MERQQIEVYVFDHASGYDWFYDRAAMEHEFEEYKRVGWLGEGDGMYRIPIPGMRGDHSVEDMEHGNEYFADEDWTAYPGCVVLWRWDTVSV